MATTEFDAELLERRLHTLKDSQESIQSLSAWCLERREHHKKIVVTWLQVLKKVKVEHRLTLFYLANDVIQYSKRKNYEFVESWRTTLQRATTMVRDEKVKHRILRIFKIWDQRQVYGEEFLADLSGLISAAPKKKSEPQIAAPEEFQAALLISTMRSCATLEQATDARLRDLRESNIDVENAEELCSSLKDRRHVEDAEKDIDIAVRNVENYVRALEAEIGERTQVLELLEQADQFYETQRGEVKIVTNAYRNFGSRVKNLKKKLDELIPTLISPIPSPDVNAPSPSPDSDIELPGDENYMTNQSHIVDVPPPSIYGSYNHDYDPMAMGPPEGQCNDTTTDFTANFSSFIGENMDFGSMRNLFNERPTTPAGISQYNDSLEANPIEVIESICPIRNDRSKKHTFQSETAEDFNISSFLKTVLPSSESTIDPGGIPGLGLDVSDAQISESPQLMNYPHSPAREQHPVTPTLSRIINPPLTSLGIMNNTPMNHSTPLPVRTLSGESHTPSPYSSQNSQSNIVVPFDGLVNNIINPLPPPPLPPPIFLDDENCYNKLPPKFPTWTSNEPINDSTNWEDKGKNSMNAAWSGESDKNKSHWIDGTNERWDPGNDTIWPPSLRGKNEMLETPESPPIYEKSSYRDPIEYNDSQTSEPLLSSARDVDHRIIPVPMALENQMPYRLVKGADVDHRNLISLTGSPANSTNTNDTSLPVLPNNNLWPTSDQDYRQHMQPGDIVESVDMEMSDDESENKQKGRVLVDVRSQDRDMRITGSSQQISHMDMDMRIMPLPDPSTPSMMQNVQGIHPSPVPPPQFHQNPPNFHHTQSNFHPDSSNNFHPNTSDFHQNQLPSPFFPNQQDFPPNDQEFHQVHLKQHDFSQIPQDFDFRENQHQILPNQDFTGEQHNRYPLIEHPLRESPIFQRNDRGNRRFQRNRRPLDEYSPQARNNSNPRKIRPQEHRHCSSPEILPNNRPMLLKPPETVVILDEEGMPIELPEFEAGDVLTNIPLQDPELENLSQRLQDNVSNACDSDLVERPKESSVTNCISVSEQKLLLTESDKQKSNQAKNISPTTESKDLDHNASVLGCEEQIELESHVETNNDSRNDNYIPESENQPQFLSEQLETYVDSNTALNRDLKRPSANGDSNEKEDIDKNPPKRRTLIPNGPLLSESELLDLNGSLSQSIRVEHHPAVIYEYDGVNSSPNFRLRDNTPGIFPPWRGNPVRGRGGFRARARSHWVDRAPRGSTVGNFVPRGSKRATQYRGGAVRGRGRGNSW